MQDAGHQGGWGVGATTAPPNPFNVATPPPNGNPFAKPANPFFQNKENTPQVVPSNPFSALAAAPNPFASAPSASIERWATLPTSQITKTNTSTRNPFETTKPEPPAPNSQPLKPSTSVHSKPSPGLSTNGSRKVAEFVQPAWPGESNKSATSVLDSTKLNKQKSSLGKQNNRHDGRSSPMSTAAAGKQGAVTKFGLPASSQAPDQSVKLHDGRSRELAIKIQQQLAQDRIKPPRWPANPGSHAQRQAMETFRESYKAYREKARKSLIRAGLIDDPDQRRTLQQALDFRGISDEMCPEWEKITRIIEYDIRNPEKASDESSDLVAMPSLMVKRLARSAAGQDAPLPMDVRSFATLRKTLDYLIDDLIPDDSFLPSKHNFLWDRTRAIRIDLSVQKYNLTPDERTDLIYCLETIARFHVTALHLLSQEGFAAEDFSEQQEVEQLGKTLISLKELYDDCIEQDIECPNEAEFRGYYIVFNARNPSIKEAVEGWPARLWNNDGVRTAMCLVEALQNTWSLQGPLSPYAPTELALNAAGVFFSIVASPQISYTMACFAEIHFNDVRKSMLQILRKSYTRPREGPKDITPAFLKARMRFDTEDEAVDFAQKHGIVFGQDGLQRYAILNSRQSIEDPRVRHAFSKDIVERKRSGRPLPEVIHETVFDSGLEEADSIPSQGDGLFVTDRDSDISSNAPNGVVCDSEAESVSPTASFGSTATLNNQISNGTAFTWPQVPVPTAPNAGTNETTGIPKVSTPSGLFATTSSSTDKPKSQTTSSFMTTPNISSIASNPDPTNSHGQVSQLRASAPSIFQNNIAGGSRGTINGATTLNDLGNSAPNSLFSFLKQPGASSETSISTQAESKSKPSLFSSISAGSKQPTTATTKPPTPVPSSLFASSNPTPPQSGTTSGGRLLFSSAAAKGSVGSPLGMCQTPFQPYRCITAFAGACFGYQLMPK
ncbi:SAC3/GANP/Nin1/mts3/eIF-3 p25 family-domain-containing protein [Xylaria arbuscula]|nr:SAC3/GANP/Nin1/mts3/eIF-3 p25 family-domain-containing protein [Xylaria arbuscula]